MKHPIYRPIAIGALLALASLTARAQEPKQAPATEQNVTKVSVIKVSRADHASIMLAA